MDAGGSSRAISHKRRRSAHLGTATLLHFRDMAGARLSPAAARPQGGGFPNRWAVLRARCCGGWGQPRSGGEVLAFFVLHRTADSGSTSRGDECTCVSCSWRNPRPGRPEMIDPGSLLAPVPDETILLYRSFRSAGAPPGRQCIPPCPSCHCRHLARRTAPGYGRFRDLPVRLRGATELVAAALLR